MMSPRIDDEDVLCELFTYLDLSDLASCVRVCSQWYDVLSDEDSSVWETQFQKLVPAKVKKSKIIDSCKTYKEKLITYLHSWNPDDCSKNIYIKDDGFTYHRRAVAQSTDAARSRIGFQSGRHCWDVWWEQSMGSHAVVGVALKQAPMQDRGYISLVGNNLYSWGWNLVDNLLYHNGRSNGKFPKFHLPQIDVSLHNSRLWLVE